MFILVAENLNEEAKFASSFSSEGVDFYFHRTRKSKPLINNSGLFEVSFRTLTRRKITRRKISLFSSFETNIPGRKHPDNI